MPFPNEHACRIRNPGDFQKESFRRIKQGKVSIIIGRLKGKSTTTTQSIRYPIKNYTAEQARASCKKKKGSFEAASKKVQENVDYTSPYFNDFIIDLEE